MRTLVRIAIVLVATLVHHAAQALPTVQKTLPLGNNTQGIATEPVAGKVFVTNFDDGTISVVDMKTLT